MSLDIAREKRFKAIIFGDVAGAISSNAILREKSQEMDLPIFQPLIGFDRDDLIELCKIFDVKWKDVESELSECESAQVEPAFSNSPSLATEEVFL
jgi:adenylyl- and sulfurtransferase ThiI